MRLCTWGAKSIHDFCYDVFEFAAQKKEPSRATEKKRNRKEKKSKATFLSDAGNQLLLETDGTLMAEPKRKEPPVEEKSVRVDPRLRWCEKIMATKAIAINKEFIQNKIYKPDRYTTVFYDRNDMKNRYDDIMCIDATRVVLKDRPEDENYIHANWMTMPDRQKYICTQGPVTATIDDLWHMVYTEKSPVIVMLTALEDEGKTSKCTRYFPLDTSEPFNTTNYKITLKSQQPDPFPLIKHNCLQVERSDGGGPGPFAVSHFIYDTWTDHTAPETATPAVGLFKLAKKMAFGSPITVHCSAGIGRTATFVGIDYASQKIAKEGEHFQMIEMMKELRSQRFHSIQSAVQYMFLHICVLELFVQEGVLPATGRYETFLGNYQRLLKKFAERNKAKKVSKD